MAKPQKKLGNEDTTKKADYDREIKNKSVSLKLLGVEMGSIREKLDTELGKEIAHKGTANEGIIVGLVLKQDQLDTERKNITKKLREVVKKRVEAFGNDDMPSDEEIEKIAEEQAKEKAKKKEKKKD